MNLDQKYKVCDNDKDNIVASFPTVSECLAYITGRIHEKDFKSYYYRLNEFDYGLWLDYGSYNHFYYILNAKLGDVR